MGSSLIYVSDVLFYVVCTEPEDIGWRKVDMNCVEDDMGRQPVIYGGLTMRG
jgi:hypothetical protein